MILTMTKDRFLLDLVRSVPKNELVLGIRLTRQLLKTAPWRDDADHLYLTIEGVERKLGRMDSFDEVRSLNEPDEDLPLDDKARRDYWLKTPGAEVFGSVLTPTEFFIIDSATDG